MFVKNLAKAILVTVTIYTLAFMAVVWAPWNPSPNFTSVLDDFRRDQEIGFWIYQAFTLVSFLIIWSGPPFSGGLEFFSVLALFMAPQMILEHYGEGKLFSLPGSVLQVVCTAGLIYIALKTRERRQPHIPA